MASVEIRACARGDIDAVLALDREWEQEGVAQLFVPIGRDAFVESLTQFPDYFLVAEHAGRVVGYINGSVHTGTAETIIPARESYVMIDNLYVTAALRHQQIGGQLVERLLDIARQRGIQRFAVSSNSRQIDQILAFYQSHGFKLWQIQLYQ